MESASTSSATTMSVQQDQREERNSKGIDQQVVQDLIQHFFANPPIPSSSSRLSRISPHLTISLPYLPISPPTFDQLNSDVSSKNLQNSSSAKSLAIFHLPILAINTLPRSNWSLSITEITPSPTESPSPVLAQLDSHLLEERSIEVWTAELQWTLRFGSINTTTTGVDGINPLLAYQAGRENENYDDYVSVGELRKVEVVFMRKKSPEDGESVDATSDRVGDKKKGEKGKGKAVDQDEGSGNEEDRFQLIHLRLSLSPGSSTPSSLLARFVPPFLQSLTRFFVSKVISPISLFVAFQFLQYFHLDQGSPRLKLPSPARPVSTPPRKKSRSRSRSRTPRPLRPTSLFPTTSSSPAIASSIPPVLSTLHVEIPSPLPTPGEIEALKSIRSHSNPPLPSSRIIGSLDSLSRAQQKDAVVSVKSILSLVWAVLTILVSEVGELYYLIARVVVLFTEVIVAMGEVFKEGVKTNRRRGGRQAVGEESPATCPPHTSSTTLRPPSLHSQPHQTSKRVSFPTLSSHFATIIGSSTTPSTPTPQDSRPESPIAPPPSLIDEKMESPVKLRFEEREMRKLEKRGKGTEGSETSGVGIEGGTTEGIGRNEGEFEGESSASQPLSSSDYPTPSSRLSSLPSPSTETFEPASPSDSSSSSITPIPLESPNLPLQVQGEEVETEESAPTSPEISRGGVELKGGGGGGGVPETSTVGGSARGRKDEEEVGEKKGMKRGGAKGRKRKGRK